LQIGILFIGKALLFPLGNSTTRFFEKPLYGASPPVLIRLDNKMHIGEIECPAIMDDYPTIGRNDVQSDNGLLASFAMQYIQGGTTRGIDMTPSKGEDSSSPFDGVSRSIN
jgi:hypothetical protein